MVNRTEKSLKMIKYQISKNINSIAKSDDHKIFS